MKPTACLALAAALVLGGCAHTKPENRQGQRASAVEFLFPSGDPAQPVRLATVAEIKVPFRVGIAFVPDTADERFRITEAQRQEMLARVRDAFAKYPFIASIELVPSSYLASGGGFDNVERVAKLLSLDSMVLLSYDQMQFADASAWSMLYWTGVGLYMAPGERYDILTSVEAAVIDVKSRKVLLRAGGLSQVKGTATAMGFREVSRDARAAGFGEALGRLIPALHAEVKAFRERAPGDQSVRLDLPPGYDPNAERQVRR